MFNSHDILTETCHRCLPSRIVMYMHVMSNFESRNISILICSDQNDKKLVSTSNSYLYDDWAKAFRATYNCYLFYYKYLLNTYPTYTAKFAQVAAGLLSACCGMSTTGRMSDAFARHVAACRHMAATDCRQICCKLL